MPWVNSCGRWWTSPFTTPTAARASGTCFAGAYVMWWCAAIRAPFPPNSWVRTTITIRYSASSSRAGSVACGRRRTSSWNSCTATIRPLAEHHPASSAAWEERVPSRPSVDSRTPVAEMEPGPPSDTKKRRQWRPFSVQPRSLLQWTQVDLHATVLRTAFLGVVAGHRLARANPAAADASTGNALAGQVGRHAGGALLGQTHVQFQRTGAVGVADDIDTVLVELLEHLDQRVQGRVEAAGNVRRAAGEGDIAGHDQLQVVTVAYYLHAAAGQLLAQALLLAVNIVTVAGAGRATNGSTDQRALGTVILAGGGRTDQRAGHGSAAAIDASLASLTLTGIGVIGTACQQGNTGGSGNQCFDFHGFFLNLRRLRGYALGDERNSFDLRRWAFIPTLQLCSNHPRIKGFSRISSPICVSGPCPVTTTASSSRVYRRWRMDVSICA